MGSQGPLEGPPSAFGGSAGAPWACRHPEQAKGLKVCWAGGPADNGEVQCVILLLLRILCSQEMGGEGRESGTALGLTLPGLELRQELVLEGQRFLRGHLAHCGLPS